MHSLTAPRNDVAKHRAIRDAALDRDIGEAGRLIRAHHRRTVDIILSKSFG